MNNELVFSQVESSRFKRRVYRAKLEDFHPVELRKKLIGEAADILIMRMPSDRKTNHQKVAKIGFDYIHADTLVYYSCPLSRQIVKPLKNDLQFERITAETASLLAKIVPVIFEGYQNHYFSNSNLDPASISEGYIEWASNYWNEGENKISWFVKKLGEIVGFATCTYNKEQNECEGVLYGVMPRFSGGGIYSDIIRFTQLYFKNLGYENMLVSTQVQNYAVQKVWSREGFFLVRSWDTFHVNSSIDFSVIGKQEFEFTITDKEVSEFALFSDDMNKVHFSDDFAQKLGLKARIAHGVIIQAYLSRLFGMQYPGEGTLFVNNNTHFILPIYLYQPYLVVVSVLEIKKDVLFSILAKVVATDGEICLLSYNTLIKKQVQ